jgi:hypothetical protein
VDSVAELEVDSVEELEVDSVEELEVESLDEVDSVAELEVESLDEVDIETCGVLDSSTSEMVIEEVTELVKGVSLDEVVVVSVVEGTVVGMMLDGDSDEASMVETDVAVVTGTPRTKSPRKRTTCHSNERARATSLTVGVWKTRSSRSMTNLLDCKSSSGVKRDVVLLPTPGTNESVRPMLRPSGFTFPDTIWNDREVSLTFMPF